MCTASIYNLVAISIDRYIAVSRPVRYASLMTPSRAKQLIISVWILSFVICFPPLIGWDGGSFSPAAETDDYNHTEDVTQSLLTGKGLLTFMRPSHGCRSVTVSPSVCLSDF